MNFVNKMHALDYINETRAYLDYLEEHINNVSKAFDYLSEACNGLYWVSDDYCWHTLRYEIENHDLSKFSKEEFTQYRASFYPISDEEKKSSKDNMNLAWEHHKESNHHHHETVVTYIDLVHMIIDWTAMSFKFGGTAKEYYEKNHKKMNFSKDQIDNMYEIFNKIEEYESAKLT